MRNVPSENILKLRELTEKLDKEKLFDNETYKVIVKKLKDVIDMGKQEIEDSKTAQSKVKCYETMCKKITNLLTNVKFN